MKSFYIVESNGRGQKSVFLDQPEASDGFKNIPLTNNDNHNDMN